MDIGVPYDQAAKMPLDMAAALLSDERLNILINKISLIHHNQWSQPIHKTMGLAQQ